MCRYNDMAIKGDLKMYRRNYFVFGLILIFLALANPLLAQNGEKGKWHYLGEIYLMFPTMSGEVGVADIPPVELAADAGSIFSHIKMGAMLYLEATNDDWSMSSDLIYMKLGQDVDTYGPVVRLGFNF